jgi:hypothetical protein
LLVLEAAEASHEPKITSGNVVAHSDRVLVA